MGRCGEARERSRGERRPGGPAGHGGRSVSLPPPPPPPARGARPMAEWPVGELPAKLASTPFMHLVDGAFYAPSTPELGESHALAIVQGGRLIYERYSQGFGPEKTYPSWSMAKSITQALVGMAAGDGR